MDRIGRYEVVGRIGSGGFATVYRVHDPVLDSEVAAKVLAENWTDNNELRERFMREAQLLRRIDSHRVVTVHDIGDLPSGQPYFVMSLANRGTLEDRLARVATPTHDDIVGVADELSDCVRAVHGHDLIHRDIKPSNLLITGSRSINDETPSSLMLPAERLVLGDFGLAKDVALQATGMTIAAGTGGYAAPEQMNPTGAPDRRTDLYAATAVMYRVMTGSIPPSFELLQTSVPFPDGVWWMEGALGAFFRRGMGFGQHERHESIDQWLEEFRAALTGTQPAGGSAGATTRFAPPTPTGGPVTPGPSHIPPAHDPNSDPTRAFPTSQPHHQPQSGFPQTGQQPQPSYPQTGQPQHPQSQPAYPQHSHPQSGFPQTGQPQQGYPSQQPAYYQGQPQQGYTGTPHPHSGPSPYDAPSFAPAQPVKSRPIWPWLAAVALVVVLAGAGFFLLQGGAPTIVGPDEIVAGELQVFTADFDQADSFRWTDWNGDTVEVDEFEVRAIAPGTLTFSVVALEGDDQSRSASHTVTITESPNGPQIIGDSTVDVGETEEYSFDSDQWSDPVWIDPNGRQEGDTYRITPAAPGSWTITLVVTGEDGTRIGTRRELTLVE